MIIGTIRQGLVIDHIPAGKGLELYKYLNLDELECEVALIKNAVSEKHGRKDILKVNEIIDINYEILAFIDPKITVNVIENGERVKKVHPELPHTIHNVIQCKNPRCITSIEQELEQAFKLSDRENRIYRCLYCETLAE